MLQYCQMCVYLLCLTEEWIIKSASTKDVKIVSKKLFEQIIGGHEGKATKAGTGISSSLRQAFFAIHVVYLFFIRYIQYIYHDYSFLLYRPPHLRSDST